MIANTGTLIYLSGDTSFIPQMKTNFGFAQRFDHAFLCMNLPYTMGVPEAAEATEAFRPLVVTPYHYRNANQTLSNTTLYKDLVVASDEGIKVQLLNFYPHGPFGSFKPETVYGGRGGARAKLL